MEKAYIAIVLDRSGSMMTGLQQTISGYNEQIEAIKNGLDPSIETLVSLVTFNEGVTPVFLNEDASSLTKLDNKSYVPSGMTAMYDAVDFTLDALEASADIDEADTSVLLVIISDGQENASRNTKPTELAERIQMFNNTGRWTITYMGANQDLAKVRDILQVDAGNITTFNASDGAGYAQGMASASLGLSSYMSSRSAGNLRSASFYATGNEDTGEDKINESVPPFNKDVIDSMNVFADANILTTPLVTAGMSLDQSLGRGVRDNGELNLRDGYGSLSDIEASQD